MIAHADNADNADNAGDSDGTPPAGDRKPLKPRAIGARRTTDWATLEAEIMQRIDVCQSYRDIGAKFTGKVRSNGWVECKSLRRPDETKSSAAVHAETGKYHDSAAAENFGFFEAMAQFGPFKTFREAREHFAKIAGVSVSAGDGRGDPSLRLSHAQKFDRVEWSQVWKSWAYKWMVKFKRGFTLESILLAGGFPAKWPVSMKLDDNGQRQRHVGNYKVLVLPVYGAIGSQEPAAYKFYNLTGPNLPQWSDGKPVNPVPIKAEGPTRGGTMNLHAIKLLEQRSKSIEFVIKAAGPSDMLAIQAAIPKEKRNAWLVIANASGEVGEVCPWQADLLRGYRVLVFNDADAAGCKGDERWRWALRKSCPAVLVGSLPYRVTAKSGIDCRDFLNGTKGKACLPPVGQMGSGCDGPEIEASE